MQVAETGPYSHSFSHLQSLQTTRSFGLRAPVATSRAICSSCGVEVADRGRVAFARCLAGRAQLATRAFLRRGSAEALERHERRAQVLARLDALALPPWHLAVRELRARVLEGR
jgi:hypothetical protein